MAVKERPAKKEKLDLFSVKLPHGKNISVRDYCERKGLKLNRFAEQAFDLALEKAQEEEKILDYYKLQKEKDQAIDFKTMVEKYGLKDKFYKNGKLRTGIVK